MENVADGVHTAEQFANTAFVLFSSVFSGDCLGNNMNGVFLIKRLLSGISKNF